MTSIPKLLLVGISLIFIPVIALIIHAKGVIHTTSIPPSNYGSGAMFDKIADRYDLINRVLALNLDTSWRRHMVREVMNGVIKRQKEDMRCRKDDSIDNGSMNEIRILDLATGTADVAILLAKEARKMLYSGCEENFFAKINVLGIDPSPNMIGIGREKVMAQNLSSSIELRIGDARKLEDLPDSYFHGVTMAFGIRNIVERGMALCEIHRVMKKDLGDLTADDKKSMTSSRVGILEFSEPGEDVGILGHIAGLVIKHIVPLVGSALSGAPSEYMHLQNSIKEFPSPQDFAALIENVECDVEIEGGKVKGKFKLESLQHLNFGSVQLYIAIPYVNGV